MKIVLATGIYPPDIGGPATYCRQLAEELSKEHEVVVVTYGDKVESNKWIVESVPKALPIIRWFAYAWQLQKSGKDADIVYAFSSVSCGVPLILAGLKKPKKVLRLGGDFFWERYTDRGGRKSLREWSASKGLAIAVMGWILGKFDYIVFSTEFQQQLYRRTYPHLPEHGIIQNALPTGGDYPVQQHHASTPFRLLFMGRFVPFKNVSALLEAVARMSDCFLTIVGEGPQDDILRTHAEKLDLSARVRFVGPLTGKEKFDVFASHNALVLPSLTEISPNTALEAASVGLPVLLTQEHGLSADLSSTMRIADLSGPDQIVHAVTELRNTYESVSASDSIMERSYKKVASETLDAFATLAAT